MPFYRKFQIWEREESGALGEGDNPGYSVTNDELSFTCYLCFEELETGLFSVLFAKKIPYQLDQEYKEGMGRNLLELFSEIGPEEHLPGYPTLEEALDAFRAKN